MVRQQNSKFVRWSHLGMRLRMSPFVVVLLATATSANAQDSRLVFRCFDVQMTPWESDEFDANGLTYSPPPRIMLDSVKQRPGILSGSYIIRVPSGAVPSVHRYAVWGMESSGDSLKLIWSTGHAGLTAMLAAGTRAMTGRAETHIDVIPSPKATAAITLSPVDCDSSPPFPIESEPPVLYGVQLVSGDSIQLGQRVATLPALSSVRGHRYVATEEIAAPFSAASEVHVYASDEVITRIGLEFPPDWDYDDTVKQLTESFGPPRRHTMTREYIGSEFTSWTNRLATVLLVRTRRVGENWLIRLQIIDPRW